ncbi:MAG TPA: hypothetical protein PLQ39_13745, partial [Acinetobacter sp.]|nr:hypothetical protein [Acinetobacter sp.]
MPRITDPLFPSATSIELTDKVLGVVDNVAKTITLDLINDLIGGGDVLEYANLASFPLLGEAS